MENNFIFSGSKTFRKQSKKKYFSKSKKKTKIFTTFNFTRHSKRFNFKSF